jgi:hypothetical protein
MNKTYMTAGIVMLVGIVIMAITVAMLIAISPNYWNDVAYGTMDEYIQDGKQADLINAFFDVGLLVFFIGIAIMAFGLATAEPKPSSFRQVETVMPLQQYQYPPSQPQQQYTPLPFSSASATLQALVTGT